MNVFIICENEMEKVSGEDDPLIKNEKWSSFSRIDPFDDFNKIEAYLN